MHTTEKKRSDPERIASRRKQVLDAAESCFGSSGFHGASMAEISKAAGMSAGHIYNYFDNKDAIIAAFVQQNVERVSTLLGDLAQREDPLQALLDDIDRSVSDNLQPGVWKLLLEIWAHSAREPGIARLAQDADRVSRAELHCLLKRGRAMRGWVTDDAALMARIEVMIAIFQGLHVRPILSPDLDARAVTDATRMAMLPLLMTE